MASTLETWMKNAIPGYIIITVLPTEDSFIDFVPRNNSGTLREVWGFVV